MSVSKTTQEKFDELSERFYTEAGGLSSPTAASEHPAHKQIVAMGSAVIPFILKDLRDHKGGHLFTMLHQLVSDPPEISSQMAFTHQSVVDAWLTWGREHEYEL